MAWEWPLNHGRCVAENGTYQAAAWTMESPWQTRRETRNACACRKACWQQLLQGGWVGQGWIYAMAMIDTYAVIYYTYIYIYIP